MARKEKTQQSVGQEKKLNANSLPEAPPRSLMVRPLGKIMTFKYLTLLQEIKSKGFPHEKQELEGIYPKEKCIFDFILRACIHKSLMVDPLLQMPP